MRQCFPALFFYVGLRLPVLFRVPFLVSDLACLVCTVQIKVVSLLSDHANVALRKTWSNVSGHTAAYYHVSQCRRLHSLLIESLRVFNSPQFYEMLPQEEICIVGLLERKKERKKKLHYFRSICQEESARACSTGGACGILQVLLTFESSSVS